METTIEMVWAICIAVLFLAGAVIIGGNYLNKRIATLVREDWSEKGLAREVKRISLLSVGVLVITAIVGLSAGVFLWAYGTGWSGEPSSTARNTVDPPEWICRD